MSSGQKSNTDEDFKSPLGRDEGGGGKTVPEVAS